MTICAAALLAFTSCSNQEHDEEAAIRKSEVVTYHDRNSDGKTDLERHRYPGWADLDWELRDDDFNGAFEAKWHYGVGLHKSAVSQSVPTNVVTKPY